MSFSATGVPKPLQSRPKKNPFLKRSSSSPFNSLPRRKSSQTQPSIKSARSEEDIHDKSVERLDDTGIVTAIHPKGVRQDVVSLMRHVQKHMWSDIPEKSAGMNSTRIAEVLNFRKNLPAIISIAHLHAVSRSTTETEREVARLVHAGVVRKVNVLGRGRGGAALGEGLVLVEDWKQLVQDSALDQSLKDKYIELLVTNSSSLTINAAALQRSEASDLVRAGFFTSTSALASGPEVFSRPGAFSLEMPLSVASAGSNAATGTLAAVGGSEAVHNMGGGGGLHASSRGTAKISGDLTFSLPMTGAYLRLLTEARAHLLQMLTKSSPKYKESTKDLLRERWNGGIPIDDPASRAKRARGEWTGVLPGKTKKWKSFYGLEFAYVLEECLGSGSVECFQTGSVGLGVRVV